MGESLRPMIQIVPSDMEAVVEVLQGDSLTRPGHRGLLNSRCSGDTRCCVAFSSELQRCMVRPPLWLRSW